MKRMLWITAAGALASLPVLAQNTAFAPGAQAEFQDMIAHSKMLSMEGMVIGTPVKGAPYAADEVTTFTQTLGDGTHIQREQRVSVYRDSQGRIRRESPSQITIMDTANGVGYMLDPKAMTARKIYVSVKAVKTGETPDGAAGAPPMLIEHSGPETMNVMIQRGEAGAAEAGRVQSMAAVRTGAGAAGNIGIGAAGPNVVYFNTFEKQGASEAPAPESLGSQTMEGVSADGTRTTETIAAGAIGNDRAIQIVSERWFSPDLQVLVLRKRTDPLSGDETYRLTNISRAEPAATLFQVPADYKVLPGPPAPPAPPFE